jgi:2,3-bisphosphoglycerate-independent phosphoglycerate mutase
MTEYDKSLENVDVAYEKEEINNTLGEVLSQKGYTQLRISETEKYAHVTFFLNGGREKEFDGEKRILVPSPKVETYDLKPEMSAIEVTDNIINVIKEGNTDCIIVNFANGDMVGHTGSMEASIKAMETVDECLGKILKALDAVSGEAVIIADHGNCEQMIDLNTGEPITTHTTFDVPIVVVSNRVKAIKSGCLADVAPTILTLMGEEIPKEMTGKPVITLK